MKSSMSKILQNLVAIESQTQQQTIFYPAWFWLTLLKTFNHTAIRLYQLIHLTVGDINFVSDTIFFARQAAKTVLNTLFQLQQH